MNRATDERNAEQNGAERFELVSRIADDVAHELKNPLNSIVINLEVLRNRVRSGQPDAALDRAEVIDAELRRLHALLEAMLRLLRPGRRDREVVALADVLEDVAALAQAQARVAQRPLVIDSIPDDMFVRVRRDALRFTLLHVIQTALRAAAPDGVGVRLAATRRAELVALRIEAAGVPATELDTLASLGNLLSESGVVESECRDGDGGSACTLLLAQARELA